VSHTAKGRDRNVVDSMNISSLFFSLWRSRDQLFFIISTLTIPYGSVNTEVEVETFQKLFFPCE